MSAIRTIDLTKRYKEQNVVDKVSLTIEEGELFALLGVNGAGKTTMIRMLSCLIAPSGGDAEILGSSIRTDPQSVKRTINLSPQETAVARNLSVRENLELIAGIYGLSAKAARAKADEVMETFHLSEVSRKKAKALSGGMGRRLSIAMALITEPKVLYLDEPTLGLDVLSRRELWTEVRKLKGKVTTILTTHYLEEAEALSDKIGILSRGALKAVGDAGTLIRETGAANFEDAFVRLASDEEVIV